MAKPRVFISSTYYDLKYIRHSVEQFIESLGYEATVFESGDVVFSHDAPLDESCYREIGLFSPNHGTIWFVDSGLWTILLHGFEINGPDFLRILSPSDERMSLWGNSKLKWIHSPVWSAP